MTITTLRQPAGVSLCFHLLRHTARQPAMKNPISDRIEDVHNRLDTRKIAIDHVGIKSIKHPIGVVNRDGSIQNSIGEFNMYVNLPHDQKGTHMSRFNEVLNQQLNQINLATIGDVVAKMTRRLEAHSGYIEVTLPFFVRKKAPISQLESLLDYQVSLVVQWQEESGEADILLSVVVPVTSLCPCSKKIADYGAHNQRSHVTVSVRMREELWIEDIIDLIEREASCEIYGLLKRNDEKEVTERAYNNPKFVEDIVRDIANDLNNDERISYYQVETENFESIHNHSAYAMIKRDKR